MGVKLRQYNKRVKNVSVSDETGLDKWSNKGSEDYFNPLRCF